MSASTSRGGGGGGGVSFRFYFFGQYETVIIFFWCEARNFFFLHQNQNIFQQRWESDFFLENC